MSCRSIWYIFWKRIYGMISNIRIKFIRKKEIFLRYDFIHPREIGSPVLLGAIPRMTVNWVIPPFVKGSGGHSTIFRFVHYLEEHGFNCRIVVVGDHQRFRNVKIKQQINEWFFPFVGDVYIGMASAPPASITIATGWSTAYYVRDFQPTQYKVYFVQDFEPYFYPVGSDYAWAEETYRFGFIGLTAGTWLKEKLALEYGMKTKAFLFSYDRETYFQRERSASSVRQVFFYARPSTQRRAFEMGLLVLSELKCRLPDIQIVLAGGNTEKFLIPFEHTSMGVLGVNELAKLYSQCDAALVLSFTNLSLLPLELMACGTPVVSNKAPCTEWLLNNENAYLCAPTVEALAEGLYVVLSDLALASRLQKNGLAVSASTDWQVEAAKIAQFLCSIEGDV